MTPIRGRHGFLPGDASRAASSASQRVRRSRIDVAQDSVDGIISTLRSASDVARIILASISRVDDP